MPDSIESPSRGDKELSPSGLHISSAVEESSPYRARTPGALSPEWIVLAGVVDETPCLLAQGPEPVVWQPLHAQKAGDVNAIRRRRDQLTHARPLRAAALE